MAEKNELTVVESKKKVVGAQENEHYVKFSKPYDYEGETIEGVYLSCLENATAETLMKASRVMTSKGEVMALPENDIRHALFVAAECTGITYEFYKKLSMKDAIKVKREVMLFFNDTE